MSKECEHITRLYSEGGEFLGVFVPPSVWEQIQPLVEDCIKPNVAECKPEKPEPLDDWQLLKDYWDFKYPLNTEVVCENCGSASENWETDNPRKFKLLAANLGGLLRLRCQKCQSIVIKRHFKDKIQVECKSPDCE